MISLKNKTIGFNGTVLYGIAAFQVWFQTPKGLCNNVDLAIKICEEMNVDPDLCIKPVPVAITATENVYEVMG